MPPLLRYPLIFFPRAEVGLLADSDLMITGKPIHERHDFMTDASIDNLIDERSREVVFETCLVEILEVGAYPNGTMLFVNRDRVRYP